MSEASSSLTMELKEGRSWVCIVSLPVNLQCDADTFGGLLKLKPAEHGKVRMYGKLVDVPRYQKTFGHDYKFSGVNNKAAEDVPVGFLSSLLHFVQEQEPNIIYKGMLINWYENGTQYIGPHSDDEKQLMKGATIYSFSFGATCDFMVQSKTNSEERPIFSLQHNTCLKMGWEMQTFYKHSLPKRLKVKDQRINVTIRAYKDDNE